MDLTLGLAELGWAGILQDAVVPDSSDNDKIGFVVHVMDGRARAILVENSLLRNIPTYHFLNDVSLSVGVEEVHSFVVLGDVAVE